MNGSPPPGSADTLARPAFLYPFLLLLAFATLGALALVAWKGPRPADVVSGAGFETAPPSPPPAVEPVILQALAPETARDLNAKTPFVNGPVPAAKPFILTGTPMDMARATDCLASALYYEAANEAESGQRAVAQVVLNRVRHPAFPASVCGVVYQGATRSTGCQFSFSCDGAMARLPSSALWDRLRRLATEALSGAVYAPVGLATHYHTDWVLPYWSAKLDKIRAERTHLFFRWDGWWGTPPAFRQAYRGGEPLIGRLARLSPAHAQALAGEVALDAAALPLAEGGATPDATAALPGTPAFASPAGNFLIYTVSPRTDAAGLADRAKAACGTQPYCKVMMWTDPVATPSALPVSDVALQAMAFSYLKNEKGGFEKALWNCAIFPRADPGQCMKARVPVAVARPSRPASAASAGLLGKEEKAELIPMERDQAVEDVSAPARPEMAQPVAKMVRRRPGA